MSSSGVAWQPGADNDMLHRRAAALATTRGFFAARGLLEVQTPLLSSAPVTDVNLHSAPADIGAGKRLWLQTSPEYAMKRLLAAGSGDIWQLCQVVRGEEHGRLHNPEFTMLEWYRLGFTMQQLIDEVAELCAAVAGVRRLQCLRYAEVFQAATGLDPLACADAELRAAAAQHALPPATLEALSRDELLDLLMGMTVGPALGRGSYTFVTHYPASQAALARLDPADARVALRFELYADGIELANGFDELADAAQQRARFAADNAERLRRGLPQQPVDERLLAALTSGLPACAGVALGFDRLLMVASGAANIDSVMAFSTERA